MRHYHLLQLALTCLAFRNGFAYSQIGFLDLSELVIVKCIHSL